MTETTHSNANSPKITFLDDIDRRREEDMEFSLEEEYRMW